jgi:capsular exopolysaccharide synthesis family protein
MKIAQQKTTIKKDEISIIQVLTTYLPYWPLFLTFLILSISGALIYLRYTTPMFEATAKIIIKDEKKGYDDSKLLESLDMINTKKIIENEIEVLQSRTLMIAVVKKLHLYAPVIQEGKVNSLSAYISSPISVEASNPDSIKKSQININLKYDNKKGTITLNNGFTGPINQWLKTPYGKLKFKQNEKYWPGDREKPFFFSLIPAKRVAGFMIGNLKVSASSKLSSVIDLSFSDEIPQRAEDILNELIISYGDAALTEKNNLAKNTLSFIEERLSVVKNDLDSIERKLQQYKSGKGAVDISRQGQLYLENISSNDKRLSDLNMQSAVLGQLEKAATTPGNAGLLPSTLGINDAALTQQMNSLNALQQQYDKLKPTVAENNPLLLSVTEQINRIKPTILSNIQSQRQSLEQSKNNLYATGGTYSSILSTIPQKEKELIEISRDQNIKNGIYSFLLQKREESELSFVSTLSDSKVVNYAQSSGIPISPKKIIIYIIALALSFGFPIILITAKETLSPKILYRKEIESLTSIPIVGEIGYSKSKDPLVVAAGKRTISAEEFRKVRVSLLSLGIDEFHKKILITSSISGEGKSFIAANLATSLSLTGKKVVLVDMDLHNPGLGKIFGINDEQGVSDYLIGEKTPKEIITSIPGNNNLFYISSGALQEDASELLQNGKVQPLIAQLDTEYDVVIIDTAPIVLITDAYLLSSLCDATLYVIRHKFTPKFLVKRIEENIEVNPIKNPAIVFNGVKTRGFFKNNYGYGYNNYVYGYDNKKKKKNA